MIVFIRGIFIFYISYKERGIRMGDNNLSTPLLTPKKFSNKPLMSRLVNHMIPKPIMSNSKESIEKRINYIDKNIKTIKDSKISEKKN